MKAYRGERAFLELLSDIKALSKRFDLDGLESRKFNNRSQERGDDGCSVN